MSFQLKDIIPQPLLPAARHVWGYLRDFPYLINILKYQLGQKYIYLTRNQKTLVLSSLDWRSFRISKSDNGQNKTLQVWRALCQLKPDVVIDIGSNYGEFINEVSDLNLNTIGIEPNPYVFDCLQKSFASCQNVKVYNNAVSNATQQFNFYFNPTYSGGGSVYESVINIGKAVKSISPYISKKVNVHKVNALTLIDILGGSPTKSAVIKMDVEGYEPVILESIIPVLQKMNWSKVILEFNYESLRKANNDPDLFWKKLKSLPSLYLQGASKEFDFNTRITESQLPDKPVLYGDILIAL
jgi:FkbM family methyltransferase